MKISYFIYVIFSLIGLNNLLSQTIKKTEQSCPPCDIIENNKFYQVRSLWPDFSPGELIKVNNLTSIKYNSEIYFNKDWLPNKNLFYVDKQKVDGFITQLYQIEPWWMKKGLDPWSDSPFWGWKGKYKQPIHEFKECVDDRLRWMCGYSFVVDIPENYKENIKYPLVIFLHGTVESKKITFYHREKIRTEIFNPEDDPFVYAAPIKLEIDWDPNKILDMIENITKNVNIDSQRIYLTGLSMGGRGSYIVASELINTFSALLVISPHHGPYDYIKLANKLKKIPILITHGDIDEVSSFVISKKMFETLKSMGGEVIFKPRKNIGHSSWYKPYKDSINIRWLLSNRRK